MLYIIDNLDEISNKEVDELIATFPDQRREQALKFKFAQGRKECALAYKLLCDALKAEYDIDEMPVFEYGLHGKPNIKGYKDIHFNMSHCKMAIVCAVSDTPIGVDVECLGRGNENLINYTMNDDEINQINAFPIANTEFIRLWTQKEAVLKLTGEGINNDMKNVLTNIKNISLTSTVCEEKGYVYSVAVFK